MASQKGVGRTEVRVMAEKPVKKRPVWPVVAAVIAAALLVVFWLNRPGVPESEAALPAGQTQYSQAALEEAVYAKIDAKDYDGAAKLVRGQQQYDEDPNIKLMLVSVYSAKNDLNAALKVYEEVEAAGNLNGGNTGAAANMAKRVRNYPLARDYYGKAIERTQDENQPNAGDDVALYRYYLKELKDK